MKHSFRITVLLLFFGTAVSAQSFWRPAAPLPPRLPAYTTSVIGNKVYFWCTFRQLYSTDNGGNSFTFYPYYTIYDNYNDLTIDANFASHGIAFADTMTGYMTDYYHGEFRTTDGGYHWERMSMLNEPTGTYLVGFAGSKTGWKFGGTGSYKTTDAGLTWNSIKEPPRTYGIYSNMYVMDENNLWLLKSYYDFLGQGAAIWCSTNGGESWNSLNTGLISDSLNMVSYTDMHMHASGKGYAAAVIFRPHTNRMYGVLLRTADFGKTWQSQEFPDEWYSKLEMLNDSTCVAFGNLYGYYYKMCWRRTGNAGLNWKTDNTFETGAGSRFYTSAWVPSQNTILVSTSKGMYRSRDMGLSFTELVSGSNFSPQKIYFDKKAPSPENQLALAVSSDKGFIVSQDGGQTWTLKHIPAYIDLSGALISAAGNCIYLSAGNGGLYKSADYGNTWQKLNLLQYGPVTALYASSAESLVVNASPHICTSADGGYTWNYAPLSGSISLRDLKMPGNSLIVGAGSLFRQSSRAGVIYTSLDGGNNWRVQDISKDELTHLEFVDELNGYAQGGSTVYATRDGGNSWKTLFGKAASFTFYDKYRGVMLIPGSSLVTSDGGRSWNKGPFDFHLQDADLSFNARGDLFASANGMLYVYPNASSFIPVPMELVLPVQNEFKLYPNHPNPFNPSTTIRYEIPAQMHVELKVYDVLGREVTILVNKEQGAGEHTVFFDGSALPSGIYIYTIKAGNYKEARKLMLIK